MKALGSGLVCLSMLGCASQAARDEPPRLTVQQRGVAERLGYRPGQGSGQADEASAEANAAEPTSQPSANEDTPASDEPVGEDGAAGQATSRVLKKHPANKEPGARARVGPHAASRNPHF